LTRSIRQIDPGSPFPSWWTTLWKSLDSPSKKVKDLVDPEKSE